MINYTPVFIHIAKSGGRSLRKIIDKILNNKVYIHHINPGLWYSDDIPKNKIIRIWVLKNVHIKDNLPIIKICNNTKITNLPLIQKMPLKYFVILRNPIYRFLAEKKHIKLEHFSYQRFITNTKGYNLTCKSILIAFTGDINLYFKDIDEANLEEIKRYIVDNEVSVTFTDNFNKTLESLAYNLKYDKFLDFIDEKNIINPNEKYKTIEQKYIDIIKYNNKYDIMLYEWAKNNY